MGTAVLSTKQTSALRINRAAITKKTIEKYALFAKYYIIRFNITEAAIRAGYSEKTAHSQGSRLLKNVKVQEAIAKELEARTKRINIEADDVIDSLVEIRDRCMDAVPFNWVGALKANELLGKHLGMFIEQHDVRFKGQVETKWQLEIIRPESPSA